MPNDLDQLQGTWSVTSLESDGQQMPAAVYSEASIVIDGDKFTSLGMGATYKGVVKLDQKSKPKAFDLLFTAGHAKGHRNLGIYRLAGDKWTICLATRGDLRPAKFATAPDSGLALETLERAEATGKSTKQKSARTSARDNSGTTKTAQTEPAASGAVTELEGEWAMVSAVMNGVAMNQEMVKWCRRITRGNVTTVVAGPQVFVNASFTLDESKKPPMIDYSNLEGASKGKSQAGIFELNDDSLQICMAAPEKPRPADFSSKPGDGRSYTTWRLIKK